MHDKGTHNPPPQISGHDSSVSEPSFVVHGTRDLGLARRGGPVADALQQSIERMSATGPTAEAAYHDALGTLRSQPSAEVKDLAWRTLRELPEEAYLERWSLVQVLTDIKREELAEVFQDVIATPIPPERSSQADYKSSTRGREVIIRTTAIDGLARLAAEGSAEAVDSLVDNVTHENHTVRAASIVALQELGGDAAERALERVADEDRDLLELRSVNIYDVPQPKAGDYVKNPGVHDETPPSPPSP
jgi:HEAT repeat protein